MNIDVSTLEAGSIVYVGSAFYSYTGANAYVQKYQLLLPEHRLANVMYGTEAQNRPQVLPDLVFGSEADAWNHVAGELRKMAERINEYADQVEKKSQPANEAA